MADAPDERGDLPLLTLRNAVLMPGATLAVELGRRASIDAVEWAYQGRIEPAGAEKLVVVATQREALNEAPERDDLHDVGTLAKIVELQMGLPGRASVVLTGVARCNLLTLSEHRHRKARACQYHLRAEEQGNRALSHALAGTIRDLVRRFEDFFESSAEDYEAEVEVCEAIAEESEPENVADLAVTLLDISTDEQLSFLEERQVSERLRRVVELLARDLKSLEVRADIDKTVREHMKAHEHRVLLKHRARAIAAELGENDDESEDWLDELHGRLEHKELPDAAMQAAQRELNRLEQINPHSAEADIARSYVEWLLDLPWTSESFEEEKAPELAEVREAMDRAHHGLDKPKQRVIEYLAVQRLSTSGSGPILCLAGPPGVGKTSLAQSIALALGRPLVRVSLGGLRDSAEIRGHRKAYVGARPGKLLAAMKRAQHCSPVMLLDEIDKLAHDEARGDPTAALLEALDPEQNEGFEDHYLNVPYDLSQVVFICTANDLHAIPMVLRDRLEIISLPGYTVQDKIAIARGHLWPRALKDHGLAQQGLSIDDEALLALATTYTREAGVRELSRSIAALLRDIAMRLAEGQSVDKTIKGKDCLEILGPPKFHPEQRETKPKIGVVTGLAWTPTGGRILFIETTGVHGEGKLRLTGQQGETMRESAQAAWSLVRSQGHRWAEFERSPTQSDLHLHIPAGAVRKDGPSAGIAMTLSILSRLSQRPLRNDIALTGEVTLTGLVLAVGGIREKVLAAHRAGLREVILPERNRKDEVDIPEAAREEMTFHYVRHMDEVISLMLLDAPAPAAPTNPAPAYA